jgi:chemotaxis response regulator CheB
LGGQCLVGNCYGKWEVLTKNNIPIISGSQAENNEITLDADQLLTSATETFGSALTVVTLSGVDMDLKNGLEYASSKGGRIILQSPDSCLLPISVSSLKDLVAKSNYLKPEEIAPFLSST